VRGQSPSSPQPSLHALGDEAIEGGVRLRTLWLGSQGCVPIEEALIEIPPGGDGPRRQPAEPPARLSLRGHRKPVSHDTPITSSCSNIGRVSLQELHGIGGPIITRTDVRLEARRPGHTAKGPGKHREAPEAEVADLLMRTSLLHNHLHLLLMILLLLVKISPMTRLGLDQLLEPMLSCYNSR
jgi:hypothetical protein